MDFDLNTLADAYLRQHATKSDDGFWAWEEVNRRVRSNDLDTAWEITLLLLQKASDDALGYVAAGPLEDVVDGYGHRALDRMEQVFENDPRLQFALSGIWLLPDSPVLQRWQDLMTKYDFEMGSESRCHTILTVGKPVSPCRYRTNECNRLIAATEFGVARTGTHDCR